MKDRVKTRPAPTPPLPATKRVHVQNLPSRIAFLHMRHVNSNRCIISFQTKLASQSTLAYTHISEPPSNINHSPVTSPSTQSLTSKTRYQKKEALLFRKKEMMKN